VSDWWIGGTGVEVGFQASYGEKLRESDAED